MPGTPQGYRRRNSLRYPGYDYSQTGAYFVTICAQGGQAVFGQVSGGAMQLNDLGVLAQDGWERLATRNPQVSIDISVVMPNHVHVLLWLSQAGNEKGDSEPKPQRRFGDAIPGSLSSLIGGYKSGVTQKAIHTALFAGPPLWQRNFYDRIVRGEAELSRIREYIRTNPQRWQDDQLHPDAPPNQFNRTWP